MPNLMLIDFQMVAISIVKKGDFGRFWMENGGQDTGLAKMRGNTLLRFHGCSFQTPGRSGKHRGWCGVPDQPNNSTQTQSRSIDAKGGEYNSKMDKGFVPDEEGNIKERVEGGS